MRKIQTLFSLLLLLAAHTAAFAQHNLYVWKADSTISVTSAQNVDSITFTADNNPFYVVYATDDRSVTSTTYENYVTVTITRSGYKLPSNSVIGICHSTTSTQPTVSDYSFKLGNQCKGYVARFYNLTPNTTYYYRVYIKAGGETYYGDTRSFTTLNDDPTEYSETINGHRFVDLGLPSGLLWAESNLGADTLTGLGSFYAWGETQTKTSYTADNSTWHGVAYTGDLAAADDAATASWGEGVRMPTRDEMDELAQHCNWVWTTMSGIKGYKVMSQTNSNYIFLPASGYRYGTGPGNARVCGYYWSSTPISGDGDMGAYSLNFDTETHGVYEYYNRCDGHSVRPVATPTGSVTY